MPNPVLEWVKKLKDLPGSEQIIVDIQGFVMAHGDEDDKLKILSVL